MFVGLSAIAAEPAAQSETQRKTQQPRRASEAYRFELVANRRPELCAQMQTIFDTYYGDRPWSLEKYGIDSKTLLANPFLFAVRHSIYPPAPEFAAVPWVLYGYEFQGRTNPILVADFDIDNDGKLDTVRKSVFTGGGPFDFESLAVYEQGAADFSMHLTEEKVYDQLPGSPRSKRISFRSQILRPLMHKGTTYLSSYSYDGKVGGFMGRQTMAVLKYLSGGTNIFDNDEDFPLRPTLRTELMCEFDMIDLLIEERYPGLQKEMKR